MLKNNKGFTLSELMAVVVTVGILMAVAVPSYRTSTLRTRIVNNMPFLTALQNDMLNYYNINGRLPNKLKQLSISTQDFANLTDTTGRHIPTECNITLDNDESSPSISMDCNEGWTMVYQLNSIGIGYSLGERQFSIGPGSNSARLASIANSLGWASHGNNSFTIK